MSKAEIGTVIEGTISKESLITAFIDELSWQIDARSLSEEGEMYIKEYARITDLLAAIERAMGQPGYFSSDQAAIDLDTLIEELQVFAPTGCYFGAHPGDGADFGYWHCDEA